MPELFGTDFITWTRTQATILRGLDPVPAGLDIENLATEIEGVGQQAVRTLSLNLYQLLKNLILIYSTPPGDCRAKIVEQAIEAHVQAVASVEPGIKQHLNFARTYRLARRSAADILFALKLPAAEIAPTCPFCVDELLDEGCDVVKLAKRFARSNDD
jgi:hypothetical protein